MRIYFTTDVHASDKCWLKFLATPRFYGADLIIVGGDITGKFIVPIIRRSGGTASAKFLGFDRHVETKEEMARLKSYISDSGAYPFETTVDEYEEYERNQEQIDRLFKKLAMERLFRWIAIAEERLYGLNVRCFVSGANDDFFEVDDALAQSERIEDPNGRVVELEGGWQLLGMGYGNPTPWNTPRDVSEEELSSRIEAAAKGVRTMSRAIMSLHVPPHGSGLDYAPKLDDQLRVVTIPGSGQPEMIPVGSTAVRDAIERHQPLLGLHGHIHESRGTRTLGRTHIVNPGSEYQEGILDGALIDIESRGIVSIQIVSG